MKVTITITQEHVEKNDRGDCYNCAVAQAINAHLADEFRAFVTEDRFRIVRAEDEARLYLTALPSDARIFIQLLDAGESLESLEPLPVRFVANIPRKYLKKAV